MSLSSSVTWSLPAAMESEMKETVSSPILAILLDLFWDVEFTWTLSFHFEPLFVGYFTFTS